MNNMGVNAVKRYMNYFTTMLLVLVITDFCMGGELIGPEQQDPNEIPARLSSVNLSQSKFPKYEETTEISESELGEVIAVESCAFVEAAFRGDKAKVVDMLSKGTEYKVSENKSSYIRYTSEDLHVEGYMATDRKLLGVRQSWYVTEEDGTITSGVEVEIEGEEAIQIWYIHYRKIYGRWKIFMLENGM
jgi:hypothetical protein